MPLFPNLSELIVSSKATGSYVDSWFPSSTDYSDWKTYYPNVLAVDTCLGSISSSGEYHFRSATKCVAGAAAQNKVLNEEGLPCPDCYDSVKKESKIDDRISEITAPVIGLAKDGRVIYGP